MEKGSESRVALKIDEKAKKAADRRKKAKRKYGRHEGIGKQLSSSNKGMNPGAEEDDNTLSDVTRGATTQAVDAPESQTS